MAWDDGQTLKARFENVCRACQQMRPHWKLGRSYGGFTEALRRESPRLVPPIKGHLQRQMRRKFPRHWKCNGRLVLAVDGTRIETPRTLANEDGLGRAGREKTAPQVFLTVLWHAGTGLPWDYRLGPGTDSERRHLDEMVPHLPEGTLLTADAGFISHPLCRSLLEGQHDFVLRVGGNVTLLTELGYCLKEKPGIVSLWPEKYQDQQPIVLRLIMIETKQEPVCLVTNILDEEELPDEEACALYGLRWGEEVLYRSCKQTLDRQTMKSRTSGTCLAEVEWTLLGLWIMGLAAIGEIVEAGGDPRDWSVADTREVVRDGIRNSPPRRPGRPSLARDLASSVKDSYERTSSKSSRDYPRKKRQTPPKPPKVRPATEQEVLAAQKLPPPKLLAE